MTRRCTRCPRGTTLVELLAVLTGLGVAMAVATGLLHTGMRQQSLSRQELERDRTAMRLARDYRYDVRQAVAVELPEAAADVERQPLLRLTLPEGVEIAYRTTPQGLTRVITRGQRVAHEDYVLAAGMRWETALASGCVALAGTTVPDAAKAHMPRTAAPLEVQLVAAVDPAAVAGVEEVTP